MLHNMDKTLKDAQRSMAKTFRDARMPNSDKMVNTFKQINAMTTILVSVLSFSAAVLYAGYIKDPAYRSAVGYFADFEFLVGYWIHFKMALAKGQFLLHVFVLLPCYFKRNVWWRKNVYNIISRLGGGYSNVVKFCSRCIRFVGIVLWPMVALEIFCGFYLLAVIDVLIYAMWDNILYIRKSGHETIFACPFHPSGSIESVEDEENPKKIE